MRRYQWEWVCGVEVRYYDVWVEPDGTLHNPHGYPEGPLRTAIDRADRDQAQIEFNRDFADAVKFVMEQDEAEEETDEEADEEAE
jgi:hypothetical protein